MERTPIDWNSGVNDVLINPKFPLEDQRKLLELTNQAQDSFQGHLFILTSGTSAKSIQDYKWVALKKSAFLASAAAVNRHLHSEARDIWLHCLPDFHVGGLSIWARSHLIGAQVIRLSAWNVALFTQ